ncbi:MAG TPA: LysM peptidoglycan-binding domain-containing protein [Candidatus Binatia bacterium]|nr:LysM peptidoglycan-binding domain-containing protein [Candidatus Binatia bacterium]
MNTTPNPLIPQGTFLEHRTKSHFRIAVFTILAVHVVLIGSFLLAGCKRTTDSAGLEHTNDVTSYPPPPVTQLSPPETSPPPPTVAVAPPAGPPAIPNRLTPVVTSSIPPEPGPGTLPPVPETRMASGSQGDHVVVKGDSFSMIAKKYGVSVRAMQDVNPGVDPLRLKIGQKLVIPARSASPPTMAVSNGATVVNGTGKTYTVKSGDTLNKIAKDNGISVQELQVANSLKTTQIKVGQKLRIPSKAATAVPPSSVVQ